MWNKLFVWNISYALTRDDLEELFASKWAVTEAILIKDEEWRSKWFGFITYENSEDAQVAKEELNWHEVEWRALFVNDARPKN